MNSTETFAEADTTHVTGKSAKKYNRLKLIFGLANVTIFVGFLIIILLSGISLDLRLVLEGNFTNPYIVVLLYVLALGASIKLLSFPVSLFDGFILEHRYGLSNQSISGWLWEESKSLLVSFVIFIPLFLLFYMFLRVFGEMWWFYTGLLVFIFSIVLTRLAPLLIFPLFYRFRPIEDADLEQSLRKAAETAGLSVTGIFAFDMSRKTKKANAALAGLGRTRRILLSDTLLTDFSHEEIETVFSHELGHYRHNHIPKLLAAGTIFTFAGLYLTHLCIAWSVSLFRHADRAYRGMDDAAFLPLFALFLIIFSMITGPLQNVLSRKYEYESDQYAVKNGPGGEAFISAMNKLARLNLADRNPHPGVEFIFYSHPSIDKRIAAVIEKKVNPDFEPSKTPSDDKKNVAG